ncbi:hypothetical protein EYF80_028402 [Liparis tanakae]|uniref:Uncharacterized protein n=1 Tax=Liparis tanakae TaxID=230148 RepID=A0A4Z2H814_9TELE|nr:hypothetical protein EYF80_028402 [Liparis tanakae]
MRSRGARPFTARGSEHIDIRLRVYRRALKTPLEYLVEMLSREPKDTTGDIHNSSQKGNKAPRTNASGHSCSLVAPTQSESLLLLTQPLFFMIRAERPNESKERRNQASHVPGGIGGRLGARSHQTRLSKRVARKTIDSYGTARLKRHV